MMIAKFIDHTVLKPDSTESDVEKVCAEARQHGFASVCILPWHVHRAWEELAGTDVAVCTVVGFPLGATVTSMKVAEALAAMEQGATEIDMVAAITALKSKRYDDVFKDIRAVTEAVHERGGIVKVIIETCLLDQDEKKRMCAAVTQAGADFIKTSTGFSTGGATIADVRFLREHVGPAVRVKASGGIRDKETALAMIDAGASRLGTSSGVLIVS
ncbi:MAG: deoxyribose-phosphate aldolase [Ignavibacteriae bacterium]|nr:MAG: deoxyribose-phosphate aldolase [Ignavibacteriota bacterium]